MVHYDYEYGNSLCGDLNKIKVMFEYYQQNLEKEIEQRQEVRYIFILAKKTFYRVRNMDHVLLNHRYFIGAELS